MEEVKKEKGQTERKRPFDKASLGVNVCDSITEICVMKRQKREGEQTHIPTHTGTRSKGCPAPGKIEGWCEKQDIRFTQLGSLLIGKRTGT